MATNGSAFFGGFDFAQPPTENNINNSKPGGRAEPRPSGKCIRIEPRKILSILLILS
jgi:hypothetical protein